jgi:hypothetical protein
MVSVEGAASTAGGGVGSEEPPGVEASDSGGAVASGSEAGGVGEDAGGVSWPQPARIEATRKTRTRIVISLFNVTTSA